MILSLQMTLLSTAVMKASRALVSLAMSVEVVTWSCGCITNLLGYHYDGLLIRIRRWRSPNRTVREQIEFGPVATIPRVQRGMEPSLRAAGRLMSTVELEIRNKKRGTSGGTLPLDTVA